MPLQLNYPGVYVEEIPSGVRTITGVATSITAFVGRTRRGPTDEPITINNFGDFERIYGGLWEESSVSFAVRDFYRNGGRQAIIVRLYHPTFETDDEDEAEQKRNAVFQAMLTPARSTARGRGCGRRECAAQTGSRSCKRGQSEGARPEMRLVMQRTAANDVKDAADVQPSRRVPNRGCGRGC